MGQYTAQQVDLVAGAVAGVFLRKFPNCVMPTEEVLEAIQSVIGEETHSVDRVMQDVGLFDDPATQYPSQNQPPKPHTDSGRPLMSDRDIDKELDEARKVADEASHGHNEKRMIYAELRLFRLVMEAATEANRNLAERCLDMADSEQEAVRPCPTCDCEGDEICQPKVNVHEGVRYSPSGQPTYITTRVAADLEESIRADERANTLAEAKEMVDKSKNRYFSMGYADGREETLSGSEGTSR
jgi:hypothetical protein